MSPAPVERPSSPSGESNLSGSYILVILLEAIVITALYWLGRYFG